MKDRLDFIKFLIDKHKYKSYLEIGVANGYVFDNINIEFSVGVDIDENSKANMILTSDEFFSINRQKFDLIYIDGFHQHEQVYRDIINSLEILNVGGTIVCHDMWPQSEESAVHDYSGVGWWNGDCYKALLKIAGEHDDLLIHVLYDLDEGITTIRKTDSNPILKRKIPEWNISVEEWRRLSFEYGLTMSVEEYTKKSEEVVICAIAKQEEKYLKNWCQWHLDKGFDRIYLYDNNDSDSEENYKKFEEIFPGQVEVRDVRGLVATQILQYKTFCDDNIYKWVAYIDIDEFIDFKKDIYTDIKQFLNSFPDKDSFILQWRCFHANKDVSYIDKPIYEYCTEPISPKIRKDSRPENMNGWYKTISRSGLPLDMNEHTVWSKTSTPIKVSDCFGNDTNSVYFKWRIDEGDTVWVNHYIIKNIEDYYYNKYKRGHAGLDMKSCDGYTWWCWNQNINYFTDIQGPLSETEQRFLMSKGMKPNWAFRPKMSVLCFWEPFDIPWYSARKVDLLKNSVLSHTDSEIIMCGHPNLKRLDCYGELDFLSATYYHDSHGSCWMMNIHECETYGQPQLVFNMGYDIDCPTECDDQTKLNILNSSLNAFFFNETVWRNICEKIIEDPCKIVTVSGAIEYDEDCAGYKGVVDEFLSKYGCENKGLRIRNNTYVTSRETYMRILEQWYDFVNTYGIIHTMDIIKAHRAGYTTIYDAWQFIFPCLADELEII